MIKSMLVLVAPLLVVGSMAQAATTVHRTAKRHYDTIAGRTIRNANASLVPYYSGPVMFRGGQVRYESGQDAQPLPTSIPPYLAGTCWDIGTCD